MRRHAVRTLVLLALFAPAAPVHPSAAADLDVTLPSVSGIPGSLVDVPITVSPAPIGLGILSIDFRLALDPAVVAGSGSKADGFLQTWGSAFTNGTNSFFAAAAAGSTPVSSTSTLLNTVQVRLRPNAVIGTTMPLAFQHILFNEGTPTVAVTNGSVHVVAPAAGVAPNAPGALALALESGNPVRGAAAFACTVPGSGGARLAIYGVDGRLVRSALLGAAPNAETFRWDLRDAAGSRVRPGVYLARLTRGAESLSRRVVVLD